MAFKFNGVTIAAPYFFECELIDVDQAGGTVRNANGYLIRERKRGGSVAVRKLYFKFRQLSSADTQTILQAISAASFTVQYPDPYAAALRTDIFYAGNRRTGLSTYKSSVPVWGEISFNCIEY